MMNGPSTSGALAPALNLAAEQEDQFDDQDDHHHEFEHEGTALVELVHHEAVKVLGGVQFLVDQVFVVGHANFGGGQVVQAGGEQIAGKNYGVLGPRGRFV